jgi:hypothetical protein
MQVDGPAPQELFFTTRVTVFATVFKLSLSFSTPFPPYILPYNPYLFATALCSLGCDNLERAPGLQ